MTIPIIGDSHKVTGTTDRQLADGDVNFANLGGNLNLPFGEDAISTGNINLPFGQDFMDAEATHDESPNLVVGDIQSK